MFLQFLCYKKTKKLELVTQLMGYILKLSQYEKKKLFYKSSILYTPLNINTFKINFIMSMYFILNTN